MKIRARGLAEAYLAILLVVMVAGAVTIGGTRGRNLAIVAVIAALAIVASRVAARRDASRTDDGEDRG